MQILWIYIYITWFCCIFHKYLLLNFHHSYNIKAGDSLVDVAWSHKNPFLNCFPYFVLTVTFPECSLTDYENITAS